MKVVAHLRSIYSARSSGAQVLTTAGTNLLQALLGLVTGIVLARLLGPTGRGELAAIQMWPHLLVIFALLGVPESVAYYAAQVPKRAGRYWGSSVALGLMSSSLFFAAGSFFMPLLLAAQSPQVIGAARWYLLFMPLMAIQLTAFQVLRGLGDFSLWNRLRLAPNVVWLVILLSAVRLGWTEPRLLAFVYLGALAIFAISILYPVVRRVGGPFSPDVRIFPSLMSYGLLSAMSSVPTLLNLRLDQTVIAGLLPAEALGLYVVAVTWSGCMHPVLSALAAVAFPRIASQNTNEQRSRILVQAIRITVLISVCGAAVLLPLTLVGLPLLFGAKFQAAIPAALVLVAAAMISNINAIMESGLRGWGKPSAVLWAEIGGLVPTAIFLLLLLRPLGIMGAALASVLGYSTVFVLLVIRVQLLTDCSSAVFLRPKSHDVSLLWNQVRALTRRAQPG